MDEIVNRVSKSPLITIDLEDFYPPEKRVLFDISPWLFEELILKEKDFRAYVKEHDWKQYTDQFVALHCSSDAIIPSWAYMLLGSAISPYAKKVVVGTLDNLELLIFQEIIDQIEVNNYSDKPVIIKGCANKPIPVSASLLLIKKLQPHVKSLMFGEACSTVPLFKR